MHNLKQKYPNIYSIHAAFPIDALWAELRKVINREALDDDGYTTTTKERLIAKLDSQKSLAVGKSRYDLFEEIRCEANREMYLPLGRTSALLKKWNLAVKHVLQVHGAR